MHSQRHSDVQVIEMRVADPTEDGIFITRVCQDRIVRRESKRDEDQKLLHVS